MKTITQYFTRYDYDGVLKIPTIKQILSTFEIDCDAIDKRILIREGEIYRDENEKKYYLISKKDSNMIILTFLVDWKANSGYGRLLEYGTNIIPLSFITSVATKTSWINFSDVSVSTIVKTLGEAIDISIEQTDADDGDIVVDFFNDLLNNRHIEEK